MDDDRAHRLERILGWLEVLAGFGLLTAGGVLAVTRTWWGLVLAGIGAVALLLGALPWLTGRR